MIFSIATRSDAQSMVIQGDTQFYLFMDMREEKQWASFNMNGPKWVSATHEYNTRLEAQCQASGSLMIKKHPRALMDKLGDIEPKINARITTGNYKCLS